MKNKLQIIIAILILTFSLNIQASYAKHKGKHSNSHSSKKGYKPIKRHNNVHNKSYSRHSDNNGNVTLGVLGATLGTYAAVDSADSGILDDSNERADRFIYNQIPTGSSEVEINNLFLSSLNPIKEYYEVNYTDSNGIKKCFKVEESGIIRSIYKKMPCQ